MQDKCQYEWLNYIELRTTEEIYYPQLLQPQ